MGYFNKLSAKATEMLIDGKSFTEVHNETKISVNDLVAIYLEEKEENKNE